jgi:hypothetical protein
MSSTPAIPQQFLSDPIKEKLIGYLASGVSQTAAAKAVGVDDSYVSQLLALPDFRQAILDISATRLHEAVRHDDNIESIEKKALRVLDQKLPYVRSAMEAAKIFATLNGAKKKAVDSGSGTGTGGAQSVTIVLPRAATVALKLNTSNQVIEVEGRTMAPLPSRALPQLAEEVRAKHRAADAEKAAELLEAVSTPMQTVIGGVVRVL